MPQVEEEPTLSQILRDRWTVLPLQTVQRAPPAPAGGAFLRGHPTAPDVDADISAGKNIRPQVKNHDQSDRETTQPLYIRPKPTHLAHWLKTVPQFRTACLKRNIGPQTSGHITGYWTISKPAGGHHTAARTNSARSHCCGGIELEGRLRKAGRSAG